MEHQRECNICGGSNFEQAQDGSLKCLGCGARFASEKELQQELQQSTEEKRKAEAKQREKEKKKELADQKAREAVEAEQNRRERAARLEREAIVLMTLHGRDGSNEKTVVLKRTEEKRVFAMEGSHKVYLDNAYGLFSADDILSVSYNFQAGKAIYTRVGSVGGVTTTPSGYQPSTQKTGNARVNFASPQNKIKMEVLSVDLAHDVAKALGRTSDKIEIYHNYKSSEQHTNAVKAALASHNEFMVANALMQDAGKGYPTKSGAQSIAATLNKICSGALELPPDIYKKLEPYFESDSFEELEKAIPQLEAISNYKDAAQRLEIMRGKYNEMVYQKAMKYSEGDLTDMEKAVQLFKSIGGYKDAFQQSQVVQDKYNENAYEQAMKYSEGNLTDMRKAAKLFESLGNYKDAALRYKGATANIEKAEKKKSKNAIRIAFILVASCLLAAGIFAIIRHTSNVKQHNELLKQVAELVENEQYPDAYGVITKNGLEEECSDYLATINEHGRFVPVKSYWDKEHRTEISYTSFGFPEKLSYNGKAMASFKYDANIPEKITQCYVTDLEVQEDGDPQVHCRFSFRPGQANWVFLERGSEYDKIAYIDTDCAGLHPMPIQFVGVNEKRDINRVYNTGTGVHSDEVYRYDENGFETSATYTHDSNSNICAWEEGYFYAAWNADNVTWDDHGNIKSLNDTLHSRSISISHQYNGNLLTNKSVTMENSTPSTISYTFIYDDYGNCVEEQETWDGESHGSYYIDWEWLDY